MLSWVKTLPGCTAPTNLCMRFTSGRYTPNGMDGLSWQPGEIVLYCATYWFKMILNDFWTFDDRWVFCADRKCNSLLSYATLCETLWQRCFHLHQVAIQSVRELRPCFSVVLEQFPNLQLYCWKKLNILPKKKKNCNVCFHTLLTLFPIRCENKFVIFIYVYIIYILYIYIYMFIVLGTEKTEKNWEKHLVWAQDVKVKCLVLISWSEFKYQRISQFHQHSHTDITCTCCYSSTMITFLCNLSVLLRVCDSKRFTEKAPTPLTTVEPFNIPQGPTAQPPLNPNACTH